MEPEGLEPQFQKSLRVQGGAPANHKPWQQNTLTEIIEQNKKAVRFIPRYKLQWQHQSVLS
jgi:hypothetical protein